MADDPQPQNPVPGPLRRVVNHVIGATRELDHRTPSSARIYGGVLLATIILIQILIAVALCFRLATVDPALVNAPVLIKVYVTALKALLWSLLFDAATALSLYGVNVWRYIAAIRCGRFMSADDAAADADIPPAPAPAQVPPSKSEE